MGYRIVVIPHGPGQETRCGGFFVALSGCAAGLAGLLRDHERLAGKNVGVVLCGGKIDPLMLADVIERSMVRAGRLTRLQVPSAEVEFVLQTRGHDHVRQIIAALETAGYKTRLHNAD